MAYTDNEQAFALLYELNDAAHQEIIADAMRAHLDIVINEESDFLAALKVLEMEDNFKPKWMEDYDHPFELKAKLENASPDTLTFDSTSKIYGQTLTRALLDQLVGTYSILERVVDGVPCQVQVTGFTNSSSLIAEVTAYGNTTPTFDSDYVTWQLLHAPGADAAEFGHPKFVDRTYRETFTWLFQDYIQMDWSRKTLGMKVVSDELQHQIKKVMRNATTQLGQNVLRARPYYSSTYKGAFEVDRATMAGLYWWMELMNSESSNANTWIDAGGAQLTQKMLEDLAAAGRDYEGAIYKSGDWQIWMSRAKRRIANTFESDYIRTDPSRKIVGFEKEGIILEGSPMKFKDDRYWRDDVAMILPMDKLGYGYMKNDNIKVQKHPSVPRIDRREVNFQVYGLLPRIPRWCLGYYNLG